MATSPSQVQLDAQTVNPSSPETESQLSTLVYDMSQQVQVAMTNMLKMINEIDQNSTGIVEEIEKSKSSALERKQALNEQKEQFLKAACAVLDMLNRD